MSKYKFDQADQDQARKLLKATLDILKKCDDSNYEMLNVLETTSVWDGVECDGHCLMNEIEEMLIELDEKES